MPILTESHDITAKRADVLRRDVPVCPACGGLQCLCRPRFFPGQLLTDEDLNRLDRYILEKNKLHNRYLHGWGVACGLEVVCDPCDKRGVIVRGGYALSPCGEDIVVHADRQVNICDLIDQCRPSSEPNCDPPYQKPPRECEGEVERWVLAVCYEERPSRGITALIGAGDSRCGAKCTCGGSGTCGCSSNGGNKAVTRSQSTSPARRAYKPQCEPTVICEIPSFRVYRYKPSAADEDSGGAMEKQLTACVTTFLEALPPAPGDGATPADLLNWCHDFRKAVEYLVTTHPVYDCGLRAKLPSHPCRPMGHETPQHYILSVIEDCMPVLSAYLTRCMCLALMPPCPQPAAEACVPIATLTIDAKSCAVLNVCNWTNRKFATTFPNLQYWLSLLPFVRTLRDNIAKFCCAELKPGATQIGGIDMREGMKEAHYGLSAGRKMKSRRTETAELLARAIFAKDRVVDARVLGYGLLGASYEDGSPVMSDVELRNPAQFLLFNQLVAPVVRGQIPDAALGLGGTLAAGLGLASAEKAAAEHEFSELKLRVAELQKKVDALNTRLDRG